MINSVPVMLLESSDSRNLAARATSSDVPTVSRATLQQSFLQTPLAGQQEGRFLYHRCVDRPGLNTFTRIPRGANSTARVLPREMIAALVAE